MARLTNAALTKNSTPNKSDVVLEIADSTRLNDTHASLIYLSSKTGSLYPADSQVLVDSWLEVIETHYKVPFSIWTSPYLSKTPAKPEVVTQASKDCKSLLKELDGSLKKSPFLAGESLTIADISLASELFSAFRLLVDENTRKGFKSTVEWMLRVAQVPEFKDVWGELSLCTQVQPPHLVAPANEEVKAVKQQGKQPAKPKTKKEEVKIDPEEQARKQQERKEKKEREAKAKLEAEEKKKMEQEKKGDETIAEVKKE